MDTDMSIPRPELLVDPEWLSARLSDPNIRIFDCNLTRLPQRSGPSLWKGGKSDWEKCHIPGAGYLHMIEEMTDLEHALPFMLPGVASVSAVMARNGVSDKTTVVLYALAGEWIVHRIWWVLKASGLDDVRILDGGLKRWMAENFRVEAGRPSIEATDFTGTRHPEYVANRDEVASSLSDRSICTINALSPELFRGEGDQVFGQRGRIPFSKNIPADSLLHQATGRFLPLSELQSLFDEHGLREYRKIITYCGGGIAASTLFFSLKLAGFDNVALYDGSLFDWSSDSMLPMETGFQEPGSG